jgi:N-methyl-L-proline demethylase
MQVAFFGAAARATADAHEEGEKDDMTVTDPLLQPFQLRHLGLRNRFMSTAHEPSYTEDGMPKERYRLYHAEKAKGGIALTMIGGSAVVSPDSPQVFGNITLYKDEVMRWLREHSDDVHGHGAAVMIQMALVQISRHEQTLPAAPRRLQAPSTAFQTAGAARP